MIFILKLYVWLGLSVGYEWFDYSVMCSVVHEQAERLLFIEHAHFFSEQGIEWIILQIKNFNMSVVHMQSER